jgi:hypothetical protein
MNLREFFRISAILLASAPALGQPIATVQSDGAYTITASGTSSGAQFNGSEYTFFSGDRIQTRANSTVLNLGTGGGLGLPKNTELRAFQDNDGSITVELAAGALLYAFPAEQSGFEIQAGNFRVTATSGDPQSIKVNDRSESVGTVEMLAGGNIKATVRSGELFVQNGAGVRYQVSAGESVGILDLPGASIRTQNQITGTQPLVLIQSPERVGTREAFQVRWESPEVVRGDYVAIAKSGAEPDEFVTVISSDEGEILDFTAPDTPGDYEIRFIDGDTGEVRKFVYLDVVEDVIVAYWWDTTPLGAAIAVGAGAIAVYIGSEASDGGGRRPVSP